MSAATPRPDVAVELDRLNVTRQRRRVLRDITASVPPGQITGLLGPSGSGKTTLMRVIVGVQRITSGAVHVLGQPAGHPGLRNIVSYVTQSPSIYRDLTVRQNVRYFAAMYGLAAAQADEAVRDVGLADDAHRLISRLSGGQQGRVSLACALVVRPRLLVMDEPTVGLDPALREELWRRFRALAEDGVTLLVSSHVMDEADRCDRLLLLRDGTLIADDTPTGLRERTGAPDLERAFLALTRRADSGGAGTASEHGGAA